MKRIVRSVEEIIRCLIQKSMKDLDVIHMYINGPEVRVEG